MKRCGMILIAVCMWLQFSTGTVVEAPEPDWLVLLTDAAVAGDREAGLAAAEGWNNREDVVSLDYDELFLLAKLITWEAGSEWLPEQLRLSVGEVALNRVASPEYPDTLEEVVYQYGQYVGTDTPAFRERFLPSRPGTESALRLLLGERVLEPQVVFQSHDVQGKVFSTFRDLHFGTVYFCESRYPELYETPEPEEESVFSRLAEEAAELARQGN